MPLTGNIQSDIHEMSHSPNHRKRVKRFGKKTAHRMEVAAAMRENANRKGKRKSKRGHKRKSKRASRR